MALVRTSSTRVSLLLVGCLVLLPSSSSLHAQTLTASLSGTVSDETGGVLPGAMVTITNAATNVVAWQDVTDRTERRRQPRPGHRATGIELRVQ